MYGNQRCKAAVIHQSGSYKEDLTILRLDGSLVGQTSGKVDNETHYTQRLTDAVAAEKPYTLVSIHNHGTNLPPSGSDFGSSGYHRFAFGIVACNNGDVYLYSTQKSKSFTTDGVDKRVDKYRRRGYYIYSAYEKALNEAAATYGIEWRKL